MNNCKKIPMLPPHEKTKAERSGATSFHELKKILVKAQKQ